MNSSRIWQNLAPFLVLLIVIVIFSALDIALKERQTFLTLGNARSIVVNAAPVLMAGLGMTLIIISGGIDLSVGNIAAMCGMTLGLMLSAGLGVIASLLGLIATGLIAGCINGTLVGLARISPFIITLGTMTIYLGIAKLFNNGQPAVPAEAQIPMWMNEFLAPTPENSAFLFAPGVWLVVLLAIFVALLLRYSVWGRYLYASGSNPTAARLSGLPILRLQIAVYTIAGFFFALAGFYSFCRIGQGNPTGGIGFELRVIAAVVVGGASLNGGQGTILGTVCGTLLIAVVSTGCVILDLKNEWQDILLGIIIIGAVAIDRWRQKA